MKELTELGQQMSWFDRCLEVVRIMYASLLFRFV
jgi:hypothetical protein